MKTKTRVRRGHSKRPFFVATARCKASSCRRQNFCAADHNIKTVPYRLQKPLVRGGRWVGGWVFGVFARLLGWVGGCENGVLCGFKWGGSAKKLNPGITLILRWTDSGSKPISHAFFPAFFRHRYRLSARESSSATFAGLSPLLRYSRRTARQPRAITSAWRRCPSCSSTTTAPASIYPFLRPPTAATALRLATEAKKKLWKIKSVCFLSLSTFMSGGPTYKRHVSVTKVVSVSDPPHFQLANTVP
jgi:hypothetical protein